MQMNKVNALRTPALLALVMATTIGGIGFAQPGEGLKIFEDNPRFFSFDGEPIFIASRSLGWTALSDPNFDYLQDIEVMASYGGNLLRVTLFWPGHGEQGGELPWVRDSETGLYDLDEFNPAYFETLRNYITLAREHNAIVNLELFDHPAVKGGSSRWPDHPMNPAKNINYGDDVFSTSGVGEGFFQTLPEHNDQPEAVHYQETLVRKVLDETIDLDNVVYSLGNECPSPESWNVYWANFIKEYAAELGKGDVLVTNMWRHDLPVFDVFDIHDASPPFRVRRMRPGPMWESLQAVATHLEEHGVKPVYDSGQMGATPFDPILHQLWLSLVGGTAGMRYHRMAPVHPRPGYRSKVDTTDVNDPLHREQLGWIRNIREFMEGMEFWTLEPLWDAVTEGEGYGCGRTGDEYIFYLPEGGSITAHLSDGAGQYTAYWYKADTGEKQEPWELEVGDSFSVSSPEGRDWVLHLKAQS